MGIEAQPAAVHRSVLDSIARRGFDLLNSVVRPAVKAGFANPLPFGVGAVVVETTGRRTGLIRQVPLAAIRVCDTVLVSTVRQDSHWLANLDAAGEGRVWVHGVPHAAAAKVTRGPLNVAVLTAQ